jgi:hypothetical protein
MNTLESFDDSFRKSDAEKFSDICIIYRVFSIHGCFKFLLIR